jgi:hypothetical protein
MISLVLSALQYHRAAAATLASHISAFMDFEIKHLRQ